MTATRGAPALLAVLLAVAAGACQAGPVLSPPASPASTPAPTPRATPSPTATPPPTPAPTATAAATPGPLPDGTVRVDIPLAGISLPVPAGWERLDAEALADEAVRADVGARYPGADRLLEAAERMGDRATPAFIALDPAAAGGDVAIAPDVAVLVAQPAVGGPLLDFVAGFVSDGFRDAFDTAEPRRERVVTPVGEAVRLDFDIPVEGGEPVPATAWVIAGTEGTLLVSVIGPAGAPPAWGPDTLIEGAAPLP